MDIYKLGTKKQLRISTKRGQLSIEQLWDLSLEELDALAVSLENSHKESTKKSFLTKTTVEDEITKLKFDLVLDVLKTKVAENDALQEEWLIKQHNKKIDALIAKKQDEQLKDKTIEELEALRK